MFGKIAKTFSGTKATIISGIFLAFSLVLLILKSCGVISINPYLDPVWITVVLSGYPLLYSAVRGLMRGKIKSSLLISIAIIASIVIGEMFASGEIAFLMAVGELLEDKTTERARKGINKLLSLMPKTARVIINENGANMEKYLPISEVCDGMRVRVLAGESIPTDGLVIDGNTSVDQSAITGESLPVDKCVGDKVFCGSINRFGAVDYVADGVGENSAFGKMILMLNKAKNKKSHTERFADKWASYLVPIALFIAIMTGIVYGFFVENGENVAIIRAVTVLVIFCPCALALATPTSITASVGQATKYGVLIKSGEALENMSKINVVAFDKTGTLTSGKLSVDEVATFGFTREEVLSISLSLELKSEHPLGKAIVTYAQSSNAKLRKVENFCLDVGMGIRGNIDDNTFFCGSKNYLDSVGVKVSQDVDSLSMDSQKRGCAVVFVADSSRVIGYISLRDTIRPQAKTVVSKLKKLGIKTVLLSGDHAFNANTVGNAVGVDEVYSELLPEAKVEIIKKLRKGGKNVCMIGDGINDAPAMAVANVGVAMGEVGSDVTIDTAGITLLGDDISKLPYLCMLAKTTVRTIIFNIIASLLINFGAIVLSTVGLLTPITGAIVHNVGSLLVIFNATLLYERKVYKRAEKL